MASHLDQIHSYFAACTSGTPEDIAAQFTEDAVIYDTNHPPVRGAQAIGAFWTRARERWSGATWTVDSGIENGDAAAIEWSMHGTADREPLVFRGSEHYRFEGDLIAEIRQYWTFDPNDPGSQLLGYAYEDTP